MSINVTSTTDSPEAVTAAIGAIASKESKVEPSATESKKPVETKEASETSATEKLETEEKEEGKEGLEAKPKKKNGFKRRIDRLNKSMSALEMEKESWRQLALKSSEPKDKVLSEPAKTADASGKPDKDKFENHEDYVEALTEWKVDQRLSKLERETKAQEIKTESEKQAKTHWDRVSEFKKSHDDFEDLMEDANDIKVPQVVLNEIQNSENSAELLYELAKNKKALARIADPKLPLTTAIRELGKFEAKIAKTLESSAGKETQTTKAPAPIVPVGKGKVVSTKNPDDMTYQEFKKYREAQLRS